MPDQLQVAKEWLADLNILISQQETKENYDYGKKRTDALGWLISRVEKLEEEKYQDPRQGMLEDMHMDNERYKQALEEIINKPISEQKNKDVDEILDIAQKALNQSK